MWMFLVSVLRQCPVYLSLLLPDNVEYICFFDLYKATVRLM